MNKLLIQIIRTKFKTIWIIFLVKLCLNLIGISYSQEIDYSGYTEIEAISGRSASLPCNITISGNSKDVAIILWYKGDTGIPIYTLDIRNTTSLSGSIHLPATSYKKRAYFEILKNPPTLKLDKVNEKDSGEYRCRVDYEKSPTENFLLNLTIIVPPKSVMIMDSNGSRLEGVIGPYLKGLTLHLICQSVGGNPFPSMKWWKGGDMVDESYTVLPNFTVINEIVIENLDRDSLLNVYTCLVSNTDLIPPKEVSVSLDMIFKPMDVELILPSDSLPAGVKSDLHCVSHGSRPPVSVVWLKDDKLLNGSIETLSIDGNSTTSRLEFIPSIDDNGKFIACRVMNHKLAETVLQDGAILNIHFLPRVSLLLGASLQLNTIRENTDVYFECNIRANPWVYEVTWLFEDKSLFTDPSKGIIVANQSLVLQRVRKNQRGNYQCSATNSQGTGYSERVYLKINFAPVCRSNQRLTYGVSRNESVRILCEVEADPKDIKFKWIFNNSHESHVITNVTSNETTSIALYEPKSRFDYGSVICQAENSAGIQREPCIFNIIAAGPPSSVRGCYTTNQTSTSFMVKCEPGDSGGLKQTFTLEVYDTSYNLIANQTTRELPIFFITNLNPASPYQLKVFATNFKGRSQQVSLTGRTLSNPQKQTGKGTDQGSLREQIMGAMVYVAGGLILFTILIALIVKQRRTSYASCINQVNSEFAKSPRGIETETYLPDVSRTINNLEKSVYEIDPAKNSITTFDCISVKNDISKYNILPDDSILPTVKSHDSSENFIWPVDHHHAHHVHHHHSHSIRPSPHNQQQQQHQHQPQYQVSCNFDSPKRRKFQATCVQPTVSGNPRVTLSSPIQPISWDTNTEQFQNSYLDLKPQPDIRQDPELSENIHITEHLNDLHLHNISP